MPKINPAPKVIVAFKDLYKDKHGEEYYVNFPMVKSLEKVTKYYSLSTLMMGLTYYFEHRTTHDLWDFMNNLDNILKSMEMDEASKKRIKELLKQTKRRLSSI